MVLISLGVSLLPLLAIFRVLIGQTHARHSAFMINCVTSSTSLPINLSRPCMNAEFVSLILVTSVVVLKLNALCDL